MCNADNAEVGWTTIQRELHDTNGWIVVFDGKRIPCDGFVTKWNFYPKAQNALRAIIFRRSGDYTLWEIIGINNISETNVIPNTANSYTVPISEIIQVQADDVIGLAWNDASPMTAWCRCGEDQQSIRWLRSEDPMTSTLVVGQRVVTTGHECREWSISAEVSYYNESVTSIQGRLPLQV